MWKTIVDNLKTISGYVILGLFLGISFGIGSAIGLFVFLALKF